MDGRAFFYRYRWLLLILGASCLIQMLLLIPGLSSGDPEAFFSRPDTAGYLNPARQLAEYGVYREPHNLAPAVNRAPGFPVVAAAVFALFGSDNIAALCVVLSLIGVATAIPVFLAGRTLFGERVGLWAAALYSFNPTVIANRPMLLSDGLFGLTAAIQLWVFLRFLKQRHVADFWLTLFFAALGALIRPINSVWYLPALFILLVLPKMMWRKKLAAGLGGVLIFFAVVFPWMYRNATVGAGYCIDVNTGAMYHQNGAMILAQVNGTEYEAEKQQILAENDRLFADRERFPDWKSREEYRIGKFKELLRRYPHIWIPQHMTLSALIPDLPTLCENLGATQANRGTLNVLKKDGFVAAVRHYFDGKLWLPLILGPLLIPVLLTYLGLAGMLWNLLKHWRHNWLLLLTALAFIEYYFFLPGPMTLPRYQLPALPLMTVLAAMQCRIWWRLLPGKKLRKGLK